MSDRHGRGLRWGWARLLVVCLLIAAVTLTTVAYPFPYVNDWMPLTTKAKAVALAREARAVAASIQDPLDRSRVLSGEVEYPIFPGVAEVLARAGRRAEAIQVAREALNLVRELQKEDSRAGSAQSRTWYLAVVAQSFAYAGEPNEAISIARTLHNYDRVVAFAAIIDAEARARRTARAAALMPELISAARSTIGVADNEVWQLRYFLNQVNSTVAKTGLHRELQAETGAILAMMQKADDRDFVRQETAEAFARAGRTAEALSIARSVEDPSQRAVALAEVGQGLARAGRREDALTAIGEAQAASRALPDAYARARALSEVAQAMVDAGKPTEAVRVAQEAQQVARHTKDEGVAVVHHVAPALAYAGRASEAVKALLELRAKGPSFQSWLFDDTFDRLVKFLIDSRRLDEALAVADAAPNANHRIVRLNDVARALVKDGQKAAAIRATREALNLTSRLHETELMYAADAAVTLARAGAKAEAVRVVRQALLAEDQGRGHYVFRNEHRQVLSTMAEALALIGDRAQAMRILRRALDESGGPDIELAVITDTAEAGAIAAAVELARAIPYPAERAQALTAVASIVLHDEPFPLCCRWLP